MRDFGIYVGPKAVFRRLQVLPIALRPLVGEGKAHNGLDVLEAVFPRYRKPDRSAVHFGDGLAVSTGDEKRKLVGGFGDGEPFHIGPRKPTLPLARRD